MGRKSMQTAALLTAVAIAATGCSHSDHSASPTDTSASASAAMAQLWDPCTLPDSVITQAGLDPSTKAVPLQSPQGKTCGWDGSEASISIVASLEGSIAKVRVTSENRDFKDVTFGDRHGLSFHQGTESDTKDIEMVFPRRGSGLIFITVGQSPLAVNARPAEMLAQRIGSALVPALPQ